MILDDLSQAAVDEFWKSCGAVPDSFPRNLERAVALALPVTLVKPPHLRLAAISEWLQTRGRWTQSQLAGLDRPVRGCLLAWRGHGVLFIDGADPEDEQRFTLAHEVAHFLLDYWLPRRRALEVLGPQLAEVLDAMRPPSADERLSALLSRVPLQPYINLLERDNSTAGSDRDLDAFEMRADRVAFVLLAPPLEVLRRVNVSAQRFTERYKQLSKSLSQIFGLPRYAAHLYSRMLLVAIGRGPSWVESLRD